MPSPDSHQLYLKQATVHAHEQTERVMALHADVTTPSGYANFLRVMLTVCAELQQSIAAGCAALRIDNQCPELIAALVLDLRALGALHEVPPPPATVARAFDEFAIGVTYVIEGSALGAQLLRRRLPEIAGATATSCYFDRLVVDQPHRWRQFVAALNTRACDRRRLVAGALDCFEQIERIAVVTGEPVGAAIRSA